MSIYKFSDFVEVYRAKAKSKDINELTGRTGRPDLTNFVIDKVISKFAFKKDDVVVDIGCGDALLLQKISQKNVDGRIGRLIGVLPTIEEIIKVHGHLLIKDPSASGKISIELGLLDNLSNIPDNYSDKTISNSTFHILQTEVVVDQALAEVKRITKKGGVIFIGELPAVNEFDGKNYGDSILQWLYWVLKNQGFKMFWLRLKQTLIGIFSKEPFIIAPKRIFYMKPETFVRKLENLGFKVADFHKHIEIDTNGNEHESLTRWDYLLINQ
ncbi:hypothetical protein A7981_06955 [Methylovorus sp. MM2]|uniref:class I SAM-dependent methyltransferase n=1 Tax=Methylovorus sp. MM2 TaxID=1848038 RepID=UPI0007E0C91F|nr:class I SAM-dependent methyltransferase [Methylovorus sp. MM2]OAM53144.1 hypothetical protein A7981_06955 [Methylovorus sp. MM2]